MRSMQRRVRSFRTGTRLAYVGGGLDQCLEQVRRGVSLDPTGRQAGRRRGGRHRREFREFEAAGVGSRHLSLLDSTQNLTISRFVFSSLPRVARHIQQQFNRFGLDGLSGPAVVLVDIPISAFRACGARRRLGHPLSRLLQRQKRHRCYSWREPSNRQACVLVCRSSGSRPCHPHRGTPRILTETRSGHCRYPVLGPTHWL